MTKKPKIKVYERPNMLKDKLGMQAAKQKEGIVAPDAIEKADNLIKELCKDCHTTISEHVESLASCWIRMQGMEDSPERTSLSTQIFTLAHEIKDVGSMCGYELAAFFGESLRDYIEQTAISLEAQRVIIQAHIDALSVVAKKNIKDDGGPAAEELKKMVKIAIEKYS